MQKSPSHPSASLAFTLALALALGCGGKSHSSSTAPPAPAPAPAPTEPLVLAAGTTTNSASASAVAQAAASVMASNTATSASNQVTVWTNGQPQVLTYTGQSATVTAIAASTSHTYVVGSVTTSSNPTVSSATLWTDGVPTSLTDGVVDLAADKVEASAVAVSGEDVYVLGTDSANPPKYINAILWKNGKGSVLTDAGKFVYANGLFVSGGHAYVTGYALPTHTAYDLGAKNVALYWVDGVPTEITDGTVDAQGMAIAVSGSDIYIGGFTWDASSNNHIQMWKNSVPMSSADFPDQGKAGLVMALALSGTNVYAGGSLINGGIYSPIIWTNGATETLPLDSGMNGAVNAIALSGKDIYAAGLEAVSVTTGSTIAMAWKNGQITPLAEPAGTTGSAANAICVVTP